MSFSGDCVSAVVWLSLPPLCTPSPLSLSLSCSLTCPARYLPTSLPPEQLSPTKTKTPERSLSCFHNNNKKPESFSFFSPSIPTQPISFFSRERSKLPPFFPFPHCPVVLILFLPLSFLLRVKKPGKC